MDVGMESDQLLLQWIVYYDSKEQDCDKSTFLVWMRHIFLTSDAIDIYA